MAAIVAADGYFKVTASTSVAVAYCDNVSVNLNNGTKETTGLGDKWSSSVSTIRSWGGSASFTLDMTDAAQAKFFELMTGTARVADAAVEIAFGAQKKLSGNVLITSIALGAPVNGVCTGNLSFTGNGAPTLADIS